MTCLSPTQEKTINSSQRLLFTRASTGASVQRAGEEQAVSEQSDTGTCGWGETPPNPWIH